MCYSLERSSLKWGIMKRFQLLTIVTGTLLVAIACSGGGRGRILGVQCPLSYKPIEMNVESNRKIDLEADLPVGEYRYDGAEFYYIDSQDTRISILDQRLSGENFKARIGCMRNVRMGMPDITVATLGVSAMKIEANQKITTFDARRIGFIIENTSVKAQSAAVVPEEKPASPKEVFQEGSASEQFIYKPNPDSDDRLEIRSSGTTADGGTYTLVTRFVKAPPPPAEATDNGGDETTVTEGQGN